MPIIVSSNVVIYYNKFENTPFRVLIFKVSSSNHLNVVGASDRNQSRDLLCPSSSLSFVVLCRNIVSVVQNCKFAQFFLLKIKDEHDNNDTQVINVIITLMVEKNKNSELIRFNN